MSCSEGARSQSPAPPAKSVHTNMVCSAPQSMMLSRSYHGCGGLFSLAAIHRAMRLLISAYKGNHLSRKSGCCECSGILQQTLYVTSPHLIEQLVDQDAVLPHSLLAQHTAVVLQAMQNGIAASAQHSHRRPKQCGISRL